MEIFIKIIQAISDSRYWLGPILLFCIVVVLVSEIVEIVIEEIEEFRG